MSSGLKFMLGGSFVAAAIGYLAYLGAANSWQYYLSVDETVAEAAKLSGARIRVSGRVAPGTLEINDSRREAEFDLVGGLHKIHAVCRCAMPDNLAEGVEVVVEGRLQTGRIDGHKIITRCASKYQPMQSVAARDESPAEASLR
jgi:cytochrome c-type biogenesis protein CcmE